MSKAFTRESDVESDSLAPPRPSSALPPGARNYMTPGGARRLREDILQWADVDRPKFLAAGETGKVAALEQRIAQTEESLRSAVIVESPVDESERGVVRFGATVTVRRKSGEAEYRIVGADEVDLDRGWVSCFSPISKALLNARLGQRVRFQFPSGEETLEILRICYETE